PKIKVKLTKLDPIILPNEITPACLMLEVIPTINSGKVVAKVIRIKANTNSVNLKILDNFTKILTKYSPLFINTKHNTTKIKKYNTIILFL
ncbi:MAG: hypothetical protein PHY37_02000, partial [Candidatus Portnoybacteria bacterium]|nr:hypothetical protein [Candidatus Portnoybacteria bacterium]